MNTYVHSWQGNFMYPTSSLLEKLSVGFSKSYWSNFTWCHLWIFGTVSGVVCQKTHKNHHHCCGPRYCPGLAITIPWERPQGSVLFTPYRQLLNGHLIPSLASQEITYIQGKRKDILLSSLERTCLELFKSIPT